MFTCFLRTVLCVCVHFFFFYPSQIGILLCSPEVGKLFLERAREQIFVLDFAVWTVSVTAAPSLEEKGHHGHHGNK